MARYIPIMKNSDCAKFPYLCTLYVKVRPIAMARYVEAHVKVPVEIEIRSNVIVARISNPCSNASKVIKTTIIKKNGDKKIIIVLILPLGISSKNIFTTTKPAVIDSKICINQIESVGNLSNNNKSIKFKKPFPYVKPNMSESKNNTEAMSNLF